MATKTITICDNCSKEYISQELGSDGMLNLKVFETYSLVETYVCKMDLCGSCLKIAKEALLNSLVGFKLK